MKKLLTAVLTLSLLGTFAIPAFAATADIASAPAGYAIEIDGETVNAQACVMVPLRAVAEKLGFAVTWDNGTVTVTGDSLYAKLTIGENRYFTAPTREGMMGASLFSLSRAPYVSGGRTYVPVELFDALLGCVEGTVTLEDNTVKINTDPGAVEIPNPFTDHATLEEAAKVVGFALAVPDKLEGYSRRTIQTVSDEMIQVIYENDDDVVQIRKQAGRGDISGDYSQYAQIRTVEAGGVFVTMKGENNRFQVAIWDILMPSMPTGA